MKELIKKYADLIENHTCKNFDLEVTLEDFAKEIKADGDEQAKALREVKRIIDRMDIDIFDNKEVSEKAYYAIHTSINNAKREIDELIRS